ncbi:MAG: DUF1080 domain-containing protein [Dehalococcoidia bacterium]|nr:DUF1080 domain-containing protein [Dehalococcoidia bacterium]
MKDNFASDSGFWLYGGSAYRDLQNAYVVLTQPTSRKTVGLVWLKQDVRSDFTVSFRYRIGGGGGADGMVFMFYKKKDYTPGTGGSLGFADANCLAVPGYGIEFDTWKNSGDCGIFDPTPNEVALIKDHPKNHVVSVQDNRTNDNQWHTATVLVQHENIAVSIDGAVVLRWSGPLDKTYGGMGFASGVGDAANWHIIDDVQIVPVGP